MVSEHLQESIQIHNQLLRALLKAHGGYECKEPEPGKFTLAFHDLWSAIRWATQFQQDLMYQNWPPVLLEMEECREQKDADGHLIWRGLRTRVGMSWGRATTKKPLNTGHADYFGVLPNRAARVMGGAHPGQVRLDALVVCFLSR
jgi:class 3 adenylate cyclase